MAKYRITPSSKAIIQLPISIGHKAEKGVEAIEFDLTAWVETYGPGTLTVIMRRWGDAIPYPIALEIDENNKATWTLSDTDTAKAGMAYAQLSYIVGDEVVKKSDIYTFRVMDSLTGEGEPPEAYESWLERLTHLAAEAMAEVLDIEGIVTDKTLTVDGGIADAKATGDALSALEDAVTEETDKLKADLSDSFSENIFDRYTPVTGKYYDGTEHDASSYNYYVVPVLKGVKYMVLPKMRMHVIKQGSTTIETDLNVKTSFTPTENGTAYITVYASDTPILFVSDTDDTLTIDGKSADAKATGSLLIPTHNHVINYDYTVFASDYVEGKYYGTNGSIGTSGSYNYYTKIPVIKDNTYHFIGGRGARYVVLYNNNVIVQTAEITTVFTAHYDGELYVTEFANTPLKMYLYNDFYKITEWSNESVNGYRFSTSNDQHLNISSTAGDVIHFKLKSYDGANFHNFLLYAVVNGVNTIVASLYSVPGEVVFIAPTASDYWCYINKTQSETANYEIELTNYTKKTIFNSLDKFEVSDRFKSNIYGKKIACLGDSFTYGVATYVAKMNNRYLSNAINYGVASSRIVLDATSGGNTIQSFLNRYSAMDNDAEIVTIFGGINDSYDIGSGALNIGDINSELDTTTFYGGLKLLVTNLMKKYPDKQIIGIIPPDCQTGAYYIANLPAVQNAEREVYNMYGIPIIDLKRECYKMSTLSEMVSLYRSASDDIHPSNAGQEALCDTISAGIRRIIL